MVNKALVLENRRGVMECKYKLVRQHQSVSSSRPCVATSSARPVFRLAQLQFQPRSQVAVQGFSTPQRQVIQHPNNLQTPTTGNQSVQRTQSTQDRNKPIVGAITVVKRDITSTDAPIHALMIISPL
jgi:hypothetical protein